MAGNVITAWIMFTGRKYDVNSYKAATENYIIIHCASPKSPKRQYAVFIKVDTVS